MLCIVAHSGSAHTRQLSSAVRGPSHAKTLGCVGRPFRASLRAEALLAVAHNAGRDGRDERAALLAAHAQRH
eukprot:scaffold104605_cov76-Phaeocystis_antarctica.AAC.1